MRNDAPSAEWVDDVLGFWFQELGRKPWFRKDAAVDQAIRTRFLPLLETLASRPAEEALTGCKRALATVLVLDQFPRNLFRNSPRAFATDALAREVDDGAIARGLDTALDADHRVFLNLPFEHSENADDQARAVALISAIGDPQYECHALAHKAVIDRFGRFPHRNAALGRASTPEEDWRHRRGVEPQADSESSPVGP